MILETIIKACPLISIVVYIAWYGVSIESRIQLLEQHQIEVEQRVSEVKADLQQEILLSKGLANGNYRRIRSIV